MMMHEDDIGLIQRVLAGERQAFDPLVERHKGAVFRIISRFFKDRLLVEDIAQEVFIQAFMSLKSYRQESPFKNWLAAIAVRRCYRQLQKEKNRRERSESEFSSDDCSVLDRYCWAADNSGAAQQGQPFELRDVMDKVLQKLSSKERMVLVLTAVEGMSVREVSQLMGLSQINVKVCNFRARKHAQKIMASLPYETKQQALSGAEVV